MHTEMTILGNGKEYFYHSTLEGVKYWVPNDEELTIRVTKGELEKDTDFLEMDDFLDYDDYRYILLGGELVSRSSI